MPASFIAAIVLAFLGMIVLSIEVTAPETSFGSGNKSRSIALTVILFGIAILACIFSASATIVSARSVGVVTNFGKPVGTIDNGFHMVAPWQKVQKFSTARQTLVMQGDGGGKDVQGPCVTVRLGNQTTACVDVVRAQWNISANSDGVIELYRQYKDFDKIQHNVIEGQATSALISALGNFDPLASINGTQDAKPITMADLGAKAQSIMQANVGGGISIDSLLIFVHYDGTTQTKLNNYAQALADTRIAIQNTQTAKATAQANGVLAGDKATGDPGVQYQNCLNLVKYLASTGQLGNLPATFNCGDPRSQVIVNAK